MNEEEVVFVTEDKGLRKTGKVDQTDVEILKSVKTGEGLITIKSKEQLIAMAKAASDTFDYFREQVRNKMTKEQAEFVRRLRVDKGYSWRAVARQCYNQNWKGWERWDPPPKPNYGHGSLREGGTDVWREL